MVRVIPEAEAYVFATPEIAEEMGRRLNVLRAQEAQKNPRYHRIQIRAAGPVLGIIYKGASSASTDSKIFTDAIKETGHLYDILTKG
jgi:hypothetical protein